jgi:hypothetical protein
VPLSSLPRLTSDAVSIPVKLIDVASYYVHRAADVSRSVPAAAGAINI